MEVIYSLQAQEDILFWKQSGQKIIQKKIQNIILDIQKTPFTGVGKPEALKYQWTGCWSKRINDEHRIIYEIVSDNVHIHSLRGHY